MIQKVTLNIFGMHCTSCAMNIDGELEDTEGVKEATTNYAKQQAEITYDPERISVNELILIIRKIDEQYDAEIASEK